MTVIAAVSPNHHHQQHAGGQGGGGVTSTTMAVVGGPNATTTTKLLVSSIPSTSFSTPCEISSYIQVSDGLIIDSVNVASTPERLIDDDDAASSAPTEDSVSFSLVDIVRALYLPFLWQSLCGGFELLRSFFMGQMFEQYEQSSPSAAGTRVVSSSFYAPPFLSKLESPGTASCLTCLAVLACVAMAVQADGITWIIVRKLRYVDC